MRMKRENEHDEEWVNDHEYKNLVLKVDFHINVKNPVDDNT